MWRHPWHDSPTCQQRRWMKSLACGESRVQGMICYEMFSSILGWSCQLYVALEFCSVLHITYYPVVPQQLYCIVLWVLLGSSTHQDSIPHSDTLIASSLQANKYYWWFEGRKLSFWIRITITNTNPIFNLILQSCVWCQNQWLLTEFWDQLRTLSVMVT